LIARIVIALACAVPAAAQAQSWAWDDGSVPFVVSPEDVVHRMLRIAEVGPQDFLIDLGSGDGRIVIGAARLGARGLGLEIDPQLVELARDRARAAGVAERARFERQDIFESDLGAATVVTMYLLPEVNLKLMPKLLALKPGTRIVSHDWDMGEWPPDETLELRTPEKSVGIGGRSKIYLWVVPGDARGTWRSELPGYGAWEFRIAQRYQELEVSVSAQGRELVMRGARLRGAQLRLVATGAVVGRAAHHLFEGTLDGGRIIGEVTISDGETSRTLPWTAIRSR